MFRETVQMFRETVQADFLPDGKRIKLLRHLQLDWNGFLVLIPAGFVCDGSSVPVPFRSLAARFTKSIAAGVLHDYLYATGKFSRRVADWLFYKALRDAGVPRWRSGLMWVGVRAGGWVAWNRHRKPAGRL